MSDAHEDGVAFAQASWARFDEEVSDELLRAVCGAFALVSAADGDVSEPEIERFAQVLTDSSQLFPRVDPSTMDGIFRQLSQALLSDPETGRKRALAEVAAVRNDDIQRELVHAATLIAIAADGRSLESETTVLGEITEALRPS